MVVEKEEVNENFRWRQRMWVGKVRTRGTLHNILVGNGGRNWNTRNSYTTINPSQCPQRDLSVGFVFELDFLRVHLFASMRVNRLNAKSNDVPTSAI